MRPRRAFTLIEVLVAVAIIAVLIGILMPAVSGARHAAKRTVCVTQMRQIGIATMLYAQANGDHLPRSSHSALAASCMPWGYALYPHLGRGRYTGPGSNWDQLFNGLYRCTEDTRRDKWSYGKSVWFELTPAETAEILGVASGPTFPKVSKVPRPCGTILYGELGANSMGGDHIMAHYWYLGGTPEVDARRHCRVCNFTFVDGHAEARAFNTTFDLAKKIDLWNPAKTRSPLLAP
jgi:prepilin-type N-terminal cleavage/methylation domain-containing protein/prepilin-type processing-associated H-X9-DG protein